MSPKTRFACGIVSVVHPVSGDARAARLHASRTTAPSPTASSRTRNTARASALAKVEPDKIFLVSDDRHIHKDSRDFGSVDASSCEHVVFRLWGQTFGDASHRFNVLW